MRKFGLIGFPLHTLFLSLIFEINSSKKVLITVNIKTTIEDVKSITSLVEKENLSGFNITIPYKESIICFLDELSTEARDWGCKYSC